MIVTRVLQIAAAALVGTLVARPGADDLDAFIERQMQRREIVGLSIAVIAEGRIVEARGYGTTSRGGGERVTPATLFQAGSISKPVAAVGALRLVEHRALALEEDVNRKLVSWRVPDSEFTTTEKVTLRRLLSHTAGLTVHGFPGYRTDERVPTVVEVLAGKGNTPAVRVTAAPGSAWRYSGGGYTVMQQLITDVTGESFPDYMRTHVLVPFGMTSSTYEQPLPPALAARTASGHFANREMVAGRWHVYPEMAAAGLWTTASDLARFAIGVQQALAGRSSVLSAQMARQMLTEEKDGYGLGPGVAGSGSTLQFMHGGRDAGFDAYLVAYAERGLGVAIMINANDNSRMMRRIIDFIARKYEWPDYPLPPQPPVAAAVAPGALAAIAGRYELQNNFMITLVAGADRIVTDTDGLPDEEFVPRDDGTFVSVERPVSFQPVRNAQGGVTALAWTVRGQTRAIARIGPLFAGLAPSMGDATLNANALTVVQQLAAGGAAVGDSKLLTAGARAQFTGGNAQVRDVSALTFVHAEDLSGRGVERHGHAVAQTLHYRAATPAGPLNLLLHVTAAGLVTDYDLVLR